MADDEADDAALIARLADELHRFVRENPQHFAVRALAAVMARAAAGEPVPDDERILALTTLVQSLRGYRR